MTNRWLAPQAGEGQANTNQSLFVFAKSLPVTGNINYNLYRTGNTIFHVQKYLLSSINIYNMSGSFFHMLPPVIDETHAYIVKYHFTYFSSFWHQIQPILEVS